MESRATSRAHRVERHRLAGRGENYNDARRSALKVDEALSDLLSTLDDLK